MNEFIAKLIVWFFIPTVAVAMHRDPCAWDVLLSILIGLFTCGLGWHLHGLYVLCMKEDTRRWKLDS